jgi:hypothetical protein
MPGCGQVHSCALKNQPQPPNFAAKFPLDRFHRD